MTQLKSFLASLVLGVALGAIPHAAALAGVMRAVPGDPVRTDSGLAAGTLIGHGVKAYYGIPFAAAPVGQNRWRAPQPVKRWKGIYTADTKRPSCMQPMRGPDINHYFGAQSISEDCLYLNVWAPADARPGANLPVVVWIFGGAFVIGSANMPAYSGAHLAHQGVVYVAANYRVGVFGFLALAQLTAESKHHASGNWGLLDQIAALKWVQRNIRAFGGNPGNVTLVGQSAGSMSINLLQASPLTRGLFERAIGMSGSSLVGSPALATPSREQAQAQGLKLMRALQVTSLAQMRGLAADQVMAVAQRAHFSARPDVDGYFLPESPQQIFEEGKEQQVPVLIGSTNNDLGTGIALLKTTTPQQYRDAARRIFGAQTRAFLDAWPARSEAQVRRQSLAVSRDSGMGLAALGWATLQAETAKAPAYLYLFDHVEPFAPGVTFADLPDPANAGAYHFSDVAYWLGTLNTYNLFRTTRDWKPADIELSHEMQDVILTFAKTGMPNTPAVKFKRFDPANPYRTVLGVPIRLQKLNARGIAFLLKYPPAWPRPPVTKKPKQMY
ncbi:MAG: carboxylesterase family protein [Proteobacteria bacterium]|nr:carboxylesterase family protein [Pseudomonadota bacterium]